MKYINRRESPRVDVTLRCHVAAAPGRTSRVSMTTENISRNGILMRWDADHAAAALPRLGDLVTVEIELPAHHGFGRKCIHCQATVVRIADAASESPRVALNVNYMDFRAFGEQISVLQQPEMAEVGKWMV